VISTGAIPTLGNRHQRGRGLFARALRFGRVRPVRPERHRAHLHRRPSEIHRRLKSRISVLAGQEQPTYGTYRARTNGALLHPRPDHRDRDRHRFLVKVSVEQLLVWVMISLREKSLRAFYLPACCTCHLSLLPLAWSCDLRLARNEGVSFFTPSQRFRFPRMMPSQEFCHPRNSAIPGVMPSQELCLARSYVFLGVMPY